MRPPVRLTSLALAAVLVLAACGDDDSTEPAAPADGSPERIVSIAPVATEMLFAIGAGDQVVAVDSLSTYPAEAPVTGLGAFEPNVEAIAAYEPDLVVLSFDPGDVVAGLEALDIETLLLPTASSLEDTYAQLEQLGEVTGRAEEAAAEVDRIRSALEELAASVPERDDPLTYYHEVDDTLYTVTSQTFIGEIYALAGLENVADPADPDGAAGGYPQLSAEFLVDADPDLIFLADTVCCGQTAQTVAARPGWDALSAVQAGRIIELDDDIASRWGPRVVDFLETIVAAVAEVEAVPAG
jgi:iron complex transport system substrate-binding protein